MADIVRKGELELFSSDICFSTQVDEYEDCKLPIVTSRECVLLQHLLNQGEDLLSLPVHEGVLFLGPLEGVQVAIVNLVSDGIKFVPVLFEQAIPWSCGLPPRDCRGKMLNLKLSDVTAAIQPEVKSVGLLASTNCLPRMLPTFALVVS